MPGPVSPVAAEDRPLAEAAVAALNRLVGLPDGAARISPAGVIELLPGPYAGADAGPMSLVALLCEVVAFLEPEE